MKKSESLSSLNLRTSSEHLVLSSTLNPTHKPSSFSNSIRRREIIPTLNKPVKLSTSSKIELGNIEDTLKLNNLVVKEKNLVTDVNNILSDKTQQCSEIPLSQNIQSHHIVHTSDDDEDSVLFDTFICENFVPFSGTESVNQWLDKTDALFHRFKISRKLRFQAIPLLVQGDAKRQYINNRHVIKSFDDFYEFMIRHFASNSITFDISQSTVSLATSNNVTTHLTSDSLGSSTDLNIVAAMTLRPRNNTVHYAEDTISSNSYVATHHDFTDTSIDNNRRKSKITPQISQNYFDTAKLQVEQDRDPEIQNIIKNLSSKSNLNSFVLEDNKLYKLISSQTSTSRIFKALYLPSSLINSLLKACHDDPLTGAHFSRDRMYYKIRPHFWWPRMKTTIQHYVKSCRLCTQFNIDRGKRYGHLQSIPPPEGPFALIGIDFCGPLPRTPRENQYVLVITDYFTRHITAVALPNCTAETTARALFEEFFCRFGIPSAILSDRGTHFQNKLMENMQNLIGYNHIYSAPYHPQTNGVVERFNATFVAQISKLQNTQHNNWDEYLQAVVFAYNTGVHKSTKLSPYELLYGRAARLPFHATPKQFTFLKPNDYFEQLKKTLRIFHQTSRENILIQQHANQTYYNKNRLNPQLKIGDKVFTRAYVSKGKLDPRFSPIPKLVVEIHHPMYIVEDECTHILSQVHISDLRPISFA